MSKKNFELLNEFLDGFFSSLKTGSGALLRANTVNPERPQFSLKLYHPPFTLGPLGPIRSYLGSPFSPKNKRFIHLLRENNRKINHSHKKRRKKIKHFI